MKKIYYWVYITLLTAYVTLSVMLLPQPSVLERFDMTSLQAKLLSLTVVIPITCIYLLALYGTVWLKSFAVAIRDTREGQAYGQMANGLALWAISLPLQSIFSSVTNYVAIQDPAWLEELVITRNYLRVVVTVIAFTLIARGAERLVKTVRTRPTFDRPLVSLFGTISLTAFYIWLIVSRHQVELTTPIFYQPDWLIIITQAIPLLFVWARGLRAMYHLYLYREKVGGKVYRRSIDLLTKGIALTIFVAITIQLVITASSRLISLNLTPALGLVYLLVIGYAISYTSIAIAAKKLKMIEEI